MSDLIKCHEGFLQHKFPSGLTAPLMAYWSDSGGLTGSKVNQIIVTCWCIGKTKLDVCRDSIHRQSVKFGVV